jgi:hypothetical protein
LLTITKSLEKFTTPKDNKTENELKGARYELISKFCKLEKYMIALN